MAVGMVVFVTVTKVRTGTLLPLVRTAAAAEAAAAAATAAAAAAVGYQGSRKLTRHQLHQHR